MPSDLGRVYNDETLRTFKLNNYLELKDNCVIHPMLFPTHIHDEALRLFYCNLIDHKNDDGSFGIELERRAKGRFNMRTMLYSYVYGTKIKISLNDVCGLVNVLFRGKRMPKIFNKDAYYEELFHVEIIGNAWKRERI